MRKVYFGFALASGMFLGDCLIRRQVITEDEAKKEIISKGVESCLNKFHTATVEAMNQRGIEVKIPEMPPNVLLEPGDSILVMGVQGLARLTGDRHHYTNEEIAAATFEFVLYTVLGRPSVPVAELGISTRIMNVLLKAGFQTTDDLPTETELLKKEGVGYHLVRELRKALWKKGVIWE
jgi:DNA-directed RNA polymerase alpha subunit